MSAATKPCPYCGEQILAVAVKCRYCGSAITESATGAGAAVKKQFRMRPAFAVLGLIVVAIFGAAWLYNWSRTGSVTGTGFTDADAANVEQDIRREYKTKGLTIQEVHMQRESPRKLIGFAKVQMPLLGTVNKTCTAVMGEDGKSFWQCD